MFTPIESAIKKAVDKHDLTTKESMVVMDYIMNGKASPAQIACFITALRMKRECINEITGFAMSMRKHSTKIRPKQKFLIDTCGTGGDLSNTFNISTTTAFVTAGAGIAIAKHGGRSVSSQCGSADLLEALGANINLEPGNVKKCIEKVGIGFMFAPNFHKSMKYAAPVRKEIGIRTVFNILGPLSNPVQSCAHLIGVYDPELTAVVAQVLRNLGNKRAFVVHGMDGLDEISISGKTRISEIKKDGRITTYHIVPEELGLHSSSLSNITGGSSQTNASITLQILKNEDKGPRRNVVLLNAAAAIMLANKAEDLKEGLKIALESITSGKAYKKLQDFIAFTKKFKRK
jgi:anthranilate phosphoribosyltransferase